MEFRALSRLTELVRGHLPLILHSSRCPALPSCTFSCVPQPLWALTLFLKWDVSPLPCACWAGCDWRTVRDMVAEKYSSSSTERSGTVVLAPKNMCHPIGVQALRVLCSHEITP